MFKRSIKIKAAIAASAVLFTACGSNADQEELKRLREENESLKSQIETVLEEETETTSATVTTIPTDTEVKTEAQITEPEYIDYIYADKEYISQKEIVCRIIVDKASSEDEIMELFKGVINNTANENMTVWFYSDKSLTEGEYDVAEIIRRGKYGKPNVTMVDSQKGDSLRNAAENDSVVVTDSLPKWSYYNGCAVSIESATRVYDYKGDKAIAVKIKFKNDSDKDHSYIFTFLTKAFQNGVECESTILTGSNSEIYDTSTSISDIKPGAEITVYQVFNVRDDSEFLIEVSGLYDINREVIASCTFK